MDIKEFIATIEEDRAKRLALPVADRLQADRETGIRQLLDYGYIDPDEAEQYRARLSSLPTDRKGLIIAYFLRGFFDPNIVHIEDSDSNKEFIHTFRLWERGYRPDEAIADRLSTEERERFRTGLRDLYTKSELNRAETFVDSKRRRLREILLRSVRARVASALSMPPEKEDGETFDSNPYVRDVAISHGYRPRAKSINETDRQAIETASLYYLDLLELALLNGEGERRRTEVYPKFLSEDGSLWSEEFFYEDEFDEVLTDLSDIYGILETALLNYYNDRTATDMARFLKDCLSRYYTYHDGKAAETDRIEEDLILGRLLNSKFRYLIDEKLC